MKQESVLQAMHIQALGTGGLTSQGARAGGGSPASVSAHAAQQAHHRIQRLVTLVQIHQVRHVSGNQHLVISANMLECSISANKSV